MSTAEPTRKSLLGWMQRASDWCNAILVKETRQALKSRQFVSTFMLILAVAWIVSVFGMLNAGAALEFGAIGRDFFYGFYVVLAFATLLVVPFTAYRSLLAEREQNTYELLSITGLSPRQIVWGKLLSALVQLFIFYSAITPFIAFASLLQGFDAPTAAYILIASMLASLLLSMAALMLSTLGKQRVAQGFTSLVVLGGLGMALFGGCSFVFFLIRFQRVALADPDFWWATGFVVLAAASYFVLFQQITTAQLTFESDNRSTGIRVVVAGQFWLLWLVFLGFLLIRGLRPDRDALEAFSIFSTLHWTAAGLFFTTEGDHLSRRVRRGIPRQRPARLIKVPLMPGGARGYFFILLHLAALWVIVAVAQTYSGTVPSRGTSASYVRGFFSLGSESWTPLLRMTTGMACYALIYLGIATGLGRWCRAVSTEIKAAHVRVLVFLVFAAGMIFPMLLRAIELVRGNAWMVLDLTAPFPTLEMLHRGSNAADVKIALVLLMVGALAAVLVNLRAMLYGVADIQRQVSGEW